MFQQRKSVCFENCLSGAGRFLCAFFVASVFMGLAGMSASAQTQDNSSLNAALTGPAETTGGALGLKPPDVRSDGPPVLKPSQPMDDNSAMTNFKAALPTPPSAPALVMDAEQLKRQSEQAAIQAQAQAEADEIKRKHEHNVISFDNASNSLLPLSPDQVRDFMHHFETIQNASIAPFAGAPKAQVRIETLSLDPGVVPPELNLSPGYVTTINMLDATGEPWPILDVGVGGNFEVTPTQAGSHVVRVMSLTRVARGNLSILLKDLPTPVIFKLSSGGPTVDLRYDGRIGKMGPGAKPSLIARQQLEAGNETMMLLLANAPPTDAKRLKVGGLDSRSMAWSLDGRVYVRTPLTLLSPAWDASASSADGMTVYEIGDAPVLLMSDNGAMVRARLIRDEDHDK